MKNRLLKVGRVGVRDAKGFIFDDCHRIYVCRTWRDVRRCRLEGWKVRGMNSLQKVFAGACPLRFINWLDLVTIVPQCAMKVTFTYETGESTVKFRKSKGV